MNIFLCIIMSCLILNNSSAEEKELTVHVVVHKIFIRWEGTGYQRQVRFGAMNRTISLLLTYRVVEVPPVRVYNGTGVEVRRPEDVALPDLYVGVDPEQLGLVTAWVWEDRLELEAEHGEEATALQLTCPRILDVRYLRRGTTWARCSLQVDTDAASTNTSSSSSPCAHTTPPPRPPFLLQPPGSSRLHLVTPPLPHEARAHSPNRETRAAAGRGRGSRARSCMVRLIADHLFYHHYADSDDVKAVRMVLFALRMADALFRATDFDGDGYGDNVGFEVQDIILLRSAEQAGVMGKKASTGKKFIQSIASSRHMSNRSCLNAVFTYQTLGLALGLSYQPRTLQSNAGICSSLSIEGNYGYMYNTLFVNGIVYNKKRKLINVARTLAHEMAHSFGSAHDDDTSCAPALTGKIYIMYSIMGRKGVFTPFEFSRCSKEVMNPFIKIKGTCFVRTEPRCGNARRDSGEECDCGYPTMCNITDGCCGAPGDRGACQLKPGAQCSPMQSECCSASCRVVPASQRQVCKEETGCTEAAVCDGLSPRCPRPRHKANGSRCNGGRKLCQDGRCSRSVCSKLSGGKECFCSDDGSNMCKVCCQKGSDSKCRPASYFELLRSSDQIFLDKGATCMLGEKNLGYCSGRICIARGFQYKYRLVDTVGIAYGWIEHQWLHWTTLSAIILFLVGFSLALHRHVMDHHQIALQAGRLMSFLDMAEWHQDVIDDKMAEVTFLVKEWIYAEQMAELNLSMDTAVAVGRLAALFRAPINDLIRIALMCSCEEVAVVLLLVLGYELQALKLQRRRPRQRRRDTRLSHRGSVSRTRGPEFGK